MPTDDYVNFTIIKLDFIWQIFIEQPVCICVCVYTYKYIYIHTYFFLFFFFFFGCACGMQKFPSQGSNARRSSDNAESLSARPPGNSQHMWFFLRVWVDWHRYPHSHLLIFLQLSVWISWGDARGVYSVGLTKPEVTATHNVSWAVLNDRSMSLASNKQVSNLALLLGRSETLCGTFVFPRPHSGAPL